MATGNIKLKVCGMRDEENIRALAGLEPDFMGFIFYHGSSRFVGHQLKPDALRRIPESIKKVGVFVNEQLYKVRDLSNAFDLQIIQLHGEESPEYCQELQNDGFQVIKVFIIGSDGFDLNKLEAYKPFVDYFLFDAKGAKYGGNGISFNWELLAQYDGEIPFFLSGGISPDSLEGIEKLQPLNLFALDINSKFEINPGNKDIPKIREFMEGIKNMES